MQIKLVAADGTVLAEVGPDGLVDADDDDDDFDDDAGGVPGTDPGEIVVRGPNLFSGYWPDGAGGPDDEGWWPTGDVAYADADGDLFLVDRLGELIIVSGFNVYPHEVELVLAGHPGVVEAAVVGVDDPRTGQAVKAYVVRRPGAGGHRGRPGRPLRAQPGPVQVPGRVRVRRRRCRTRPPARCARACCVRRAARREAG